MYDDDKYFAKISADTDKKRIPGWAFAPPGMFQESLPHDCSGVLIILCADSAGVDQFGNQCCAAVFQGNS